MIRQLLSSASCRAQAGKYDHQAAVFTASSPSENGVSKVYIFLIRITSRVDLAMSVCPSVRLSVRPDER